LLRTNRRVVCQFRGFVRPENSGSDFLGVGEGLKTWGVFRKLVVTEITGLHPCGDDKIVERYLSLSQVLAVRLNGPGIKV